MNVPPVLINLVDVFIVLRKWKEGSNVIRTVSEVVETAGMEHQMVLLSTIWSREPREPSLHRLVEICPSSAFRDKLALESGCTAAQIMEETSRRVEIMRRMQASQRFPTIEEVTRFCQLYSDQPEEAMRQLGMDPAAPSALQPDMKKIRAR
jgi:hypothetical protein